MEEHKTGRKGREFPSWSMGWGGAISSRKFKKDLTEKVAFIPKFEGAQGKFMHGIERGLSF